MSGAAEASGTPPFSAMYAAASPLPGAAASRATANSLIGFQVFGGSGRQSISRESCGSVGRSVSFTGEPSPTPRSAWSKKPSAAATISRL
jgi:hypothetical protein